MSKNLCKQGLRRCYECKKVLPLNEENFHKTLYICKKCKSIYAKQRMDSLTPEQKEKIKARGRIRSKYRRDNATPEQKAKKRESNRLSAQRQRWKLRFAVFQRDNFTCQYCGRKAPDVELQVDHIYPKSKGGLHEMKNYRTACKECNIGKNDSVLNEFN